MMRTIVLLTAGLLATGAAGLRAAPRSSSPGPSAVGMDEEQAGDPGAPVEKLTVAPEIRQEITRAMSRSSRGPKKNPELVAQRMLKIARSYTEPPPSTRPVSRSSDPQQVAKFLKPWGFGLKYSKWPSKGKWVPYCACGVAWAAAAAYCQERPVIQVNPANDVKRYKGVMPDIRKHYFYPSPSCGVMLAQAQARGNWRPRAKVQIRDVKPGWLVLYNWKGKARPQHVGIVEKALPDRLNTIEFNTSVSNNSNGGAVSTRHRPYQYVLGYIATY
jgi:hypothetical protein